MAHQQSFPVQVSDLMFPAVIQPGRPLTNLEFQLFAQRNEPYRCERTREGAVILYAPIGTVAERLASAARTALFRWNQIGQTGIIFGAKAVFELPDTSLLTPTAAWLTLDRWSTLTSVQQQQLFPIAPDFVLEVRSYMDTRAISEAKMQAWQQNGVPQAWLIDPIGATVTVYRQNDPNDTFERPDTLAADPPLEGLTLQCTSFWPSKTPASYDSQ